jgi:hypothetical protein
VEFPLKLKMDPPYDPVVPLMGIYLKTMSEYNGDTYTPLFIAALFTMAKLWKQPRCGMIDPWIK